MKDNNTGKNKNFYSRGKEIFDGIEPLYKNSKRITKNELHNVPIQQHRPGQQSTGRKTYLQVKPANTSSNSDTYTKWNHGAGVDHLGNRNAG